MYLQKLALVCGRNLLYTNFAESSHVPNLNIVSTTDHTRFGSLITRRTGSGNKTTALVISAETMGELGTRPKSCSWDGNGTQAINTGTMGGLGMGPETCTLAGNGTQAISAGTMGGLGMRPDTCSWSGNGTQAISILGQWVGWERDSPAPPGHLSLQELHSDDGKDVVDDNQQESNAMGGGNGGVNTVRPI